MNEAEIDTLARTIYGEARGEPRLGKIAVAQVVLNRLKIAKSKGSYWWGSDVIAVCRKPWQFSCWNDKDANREKIETISLSNRVFASCYKIAELVIGGKVDDPSCGATHYHALSCHPAWAKGLKPCAIVGNHYFYRDIP